MAAVDELMSYAKMADPYRNAPANLAELQLEAVRERFADRRERIKVVDKRAREVGIDEIRTLDDVVPLLFAHTNYKSYPEAFIDAGQWKHLSAWLQTLSAYPTSNIDVDGVRNVDDWIDRAHRAGHYVFASSGTSGKSSFLNQSAIDREFSIPGCFSAFNMATPDFQPSRDRHVYIQQPAKGTHKMIEVVQAYMEQWALPDGIHRAIDEPLLAMETIRPAQLRRLLAVGKASPNEIAAFEEDVAERQQRRAASYAAWVDEIVARRHEPLLLGMMWGGAYNLVEGLRERGVKSGDFHPQTILSLGGGIKGAILPPDYREQILSFLGITPDRLGNCYGMVEMSGMCALIQPHNAYGIPPWIVPLILDKAGEKLLNPTGGKGIVEGRMAFFDIVADARWGGMISGDKVQVEFGGELDGVTTPIIRSVARYSELEEGDDKLTCAGSIDAYVRGAIAA